MQATSPEAGCATHLEMYSVLVTLGRASEGVGIKPIEVGTSIPYARNLCQMQKLSRVVWVSLERIFDKLVRWVTVSPLQAEPGTRTICERPPSAGLRAGRYARSNGWLSKLTAGGASIKAILCNADPLRSDSGSRLPCPCST